MRQIIHPCLAIEHLKAYDAKKEGLTGTMMLLPDVFPSSSHPFQPQPPPPGRFVQTMDDWMVVDVYVDETNHTVRKVHLYLQMDDDEENYYINNEHQVKKLQYKYDYDRGQDDYSHCTIYCIRRTVRDIINFFSGGDDDCNQSREIESLQVGYYSIFGKTGEMNDDLMDAISRGCTNLKSLSIHSTLYSCRSICKLMRAIHPTLENLDLLSFGLDTDNRQGEYNGNDDQEDYDFDDVSKDIKACKLLRRVRHYRGYPYVLTHYILWGLLGHDNIQEIECLFNCCPSQIEMHFLPILLRTCPSLTKLSVNPASGLDEALGDIKCLVNEMKVAPSLSELDLTNWRLDENGWRCLSHYLKNCHHYPSGLTTLKLFDVPHDGDISFICQNKTLKTLSIASLGDTQILKLLNENSSITYLDLQCISVIYQGTHALNSSLCSNHSLKKLRLNIGLYEGGALVSHTLKFLLEWINGDASGVEELQINLWELPDPETTLEDILKFIERTSKPMRSLRIQTKRHDNGHEERKAIKLCFLNALSRNPFGLDELVVDVHFWSGVSRWDFRSCRYQNHVSVDFTWRLNKWKSLSQKIDVGQKRRLTGGIVASLSDPSIIYHALRRGILFDSLLERRPLPPPPP